MGSGNEIDRGIIRFENSGLPVELRMPKPEINMAKMASSETCPLSLMEKDKV